MRALQQPLGLGITSVEDHPADAELTAEAGELAGRATAGGDRALAIPDQLLRQRTDPAQIARHPQRMSGARLLKISVPAITRDQHSSLVTTQPRRVCPRP